MNLHRRIEAQLQLGLAGDVHSPRSGDKRIDIYMLANEVRVLAQVALERSHAGPGCDLDQARLALARAWAKLDDYLDRTDAG